MAEPTELNIEGFLAEQAREDEEADREEEERRKREVRWHAHSPPQDFSPKVFVAVGGPYPRTV